MRKFIMAFIFLVMHNVNSTENLLTELTLVGHSSFSVLFWDIYDIELKTLNGFYAAGKYPLAIELTYKREISSVELVKETLKQWQRLKLTEYKKKNWEKRLLDMWPNVKPQDKISFYIDNNKVTFFYFNKTFIGKINQEEFSEAFSSIWLDPNGPYPEMTKELTGLTGSD